MAIYMHKSEKKNMFFPNRLSSVKETLPSRPEIPSYQLSATRIWCDMSLPKPTCSFKGWHANNVVCYSWILRLWCRKGTTNRKQNSKNSWGKITGLHDFKGNIFQFSPVCGMLRDARPIWFVLEHFIEKITRYLIWVLLNTCLIYPSPPRDRENNISLRLERAQNKKQSNGGHRHLIPCTHSMVPISRTQLIQTVR